MEEGAFFGLGGGGVCFDSAASGHLDVVRVLHHLLESAFLLLLGEVVGPCLVVFLSFLDLALTLP